MDPDPPPTLTLGTPTDIIAAVPYLLGYHPADTLVVLGLSGPTSRLRATFRCDLTAEVAGDLATTVVDTLHAECHSALLVGYGPASRVTPCVDSLRARMRAGGVTVREALRVTEGRYWSYLCSSAECCSADGVAVDLSASHVPAMAVASGLTAWPDRDHIRAFLAPVTGAVRQRMRRATRRAESRGRHLRDRAVPGSRDSFGPRFRLTGVAAVRSAVDAARDEGAVPGDPDALAWLGVVLRCIRVRDEAWARVDDESADTHVRLWRQVLRHVEPRYTAAPGSLLAVAAWQRGDIALAELALDTVHQATPDYSMAALVRQALRIGMPWERFTPEWLEEVWPVSGDGA